MQDPLAQDVFLVKEHVGMFKSANAYDMYDPETGEIVLNCREPNLGFFTRLARFSDFKRMTPFDMVISTPDGRQVVRVARGMAMFVSHVQVYDENDQFIGGFKQKFFALIRQKFTVLDEDDQPLCTLQGSWSSWNFRFMAGETEIASVNKKWTGIGKEMFTSADNYVLQIDQSVPPGSALRKLILAAVVCIDMVLKE